jgi:hypothetical protein
MVYTLWPECQWPAAVPMSSWMARDAMLPERAVVLASTSLGNRDALADAQNDHAI